MKSNRVKNSEEVRNFRAEVVTWIGGGTGLMAILSAVIYVSTQLTSLNKSVEQIGKVAESVEQLQRNTDRIGSKINDEIIPVLNEVLSGERQRTIKEINLGLQQQKDIGAKFEPQENEETTSTYEVKGIAQNSSDTFEHVFDIDSIGIYIRTTDSTNVKSQNREFIALKFLEKMLGDSRTENDSLRDRLVTNLLEEINLSQIEFSDLVSGSSIGDSLDSKTRLPIDSLSVSFTVLDSLRKIARRDSINVTKKSLDKKTLLILGAAAAIISFTTQFGKDKDNKTHPPAIP